ncbi:MAG: leucyl/phenylalanyl-tRNA--protein transferase [Saprospiraceae bacterium]
MMLKTDLWFPDVEESTEEGIVAMGGDLSAERLILAYSKGIFPWYSSDKSPILWWSPDPRFVLFPENLIVSKSMRPYFNQNKFKVTWDQNFEDVIKNCQKIDREDQLGTWITSKMLAAYIQLHKKGYAHSVEVWLGNELVGGLYGISLGKVFFGESMFAKVSNASKFGFISLVNQLKQKGFLLIDCQQETKHLESLGANAIKRKDFIDILNHNNIEETYIGSWENYFNH